MLDSHAPTKKEGPGGSLTKSPSPGANQMRMRMPGQGGAVAGSVAEQPGFDFHDVQSVADSWLKLFQDEDVEDDSFLFQGMNAPRGGAARLAAVIYRRRRDGWDRHALAAARSKQTALETAILGLHIWACGAGPLQQFRSDSAN